MKTQSIVTVIGATGNIGTHLVSLLLDRGVKVNAVARAGEKLDKLTAKGAVPYAGNVEDAGFLHSAMVDADAVFALIPPKYNAEDFRGYQNLVGDAISRAIHQSGVKKVVNLSSVGAHLDFGTGPILGLRDQEKRLEQIPGLDLVHLRPSYFFENVFFGLGVIKEHGIFGTPIKGDVRFPQIATADIAQIAADLLVESGPGSHGKSVRIVEIAGPKDISMRELTEDLANETQKQSLPYVEFAPSDAKAAMVQGGLSSDVADKFVELYSAINTGHLASTGQLQRTPTSFRDFARNVGIANLV